MLRVAGIHRRKLNFKFRNTHHVRIGQTKITIEPPVCEENVPKNYLQYFTSQTSLTHLQWMMQKEDLKQDIFLIGAPGPLRRRLALAFCELARKEVEVVSISQDTTEADLKQRREIINDASIYIDQGPVRAALEVI